MITSPSNERIKELLRLRRRSRGGGEILIDGVREISRAAAAGAAILELYYCQELWEAAPGGALVNAVQATGARAVEVTRPVFEKIRYGDRTGGVLAVARRPHRTLDGLTLSSSPLVAILEGVEKPGNLGAIVRTADGAGVEAVIVVDPAIDVYGPNAIRASVSTIFSVPVVEAPSDAARAWVSARGMQVVAADPAADELYTSIDMARPTALVYGSESRGLSDAWRGAETRLVRVPMAGLADSLNVATTAAVMFYEARRQRGERGRAPGN